MEVFQTSISQGENPQMFTLLDILMGYANWDSDCRESFSQMKLTKTRLRNRLSGINLCCLVRIAVEGPELNEVNFEEIVDVFITGA